MLRVINDGRAYKNGTAKQAAEKAFADGRETLSA
jgi:hypothetical protein